MTMMLEPGAEKRPSRRRGLEWLSARFSRWHLRLFAAVWLAFTALTFFVVSRGVDNVPRRPWIVAATTAGTLLGPMTGAISRDMQSCCLEASLGLLPYCLAALAGAALVQIVVPPRWAWLRVLRLLAWTAGLVVWFGGGIVSFGHALS